MISFKSIIKSLYIAIYRLLNHQHINIYFNKYDENLVIHIYFLLMDLVLKFETYYDF